MPAYWLARVRISEPVAYKKYTDRLPPLFEKYNARILARGGDYKLLEGETAYERFVVIEFDTMEAGEAFFNSPEYQEAARFRRAPGVAVHEQLIVEGCDSPPRTYRQRGSGPPLRGVAGELRKQAARHRPD